LAADSSKNLSFPHTFKEEPMRLSRLFIALAVAALFWPANASAEWLLFHGHRRPFQWMEPSTPETTTTAPEVKSEPLTPQTPMPEATTEPPMSASPLVSAALGDDFLAVTQPGYLDLAIPINQIRLRYDAGSNFNRPDRAEFFYGKCGCFGFRAPGPLLPERSVDYQEATAIIELAPTNRFSAFIEMPYRFINPDVNANANGFSDLRVGFKAAMIAKPDEYLTFQFRTYIPTGDARQGLGTNHVSLEPSLLYYRKLSDRAVLFGQVGDWIPVGGTDFSGNVLDYGIGFGYAAYQTNKMRVTPLVEMLGWSVLNGKEFTGVSTIPPGQVRDANATIVNAKFGVRVDAGRQSIYAGYGRAITGETWYQDIWRIEYRLRF
jgi:hypothetical protein